MNNGKTNSKVQMTVRLEQEVFRAAREAERRTGLPRSVVVAEAAREVLVPPPHESPEARMERLSARVLSRLTALEKKLGTTLLDRSVRPLRVTEAGRVFLEGIDEVLERYDRLERRVAALHEEPEGVVRVAAIYSAGIDLLREAQASFHERFPKARVVVQYERPEGVYERVLEQDCDLGIVSYPQRWRKVGIVSLRDETMVAVCHPGHELAGWAHVLASELKRWPMAAFDVDLPVGRRVRQYLRTHGDPPTIAASFDNIDTLKSAVRVTDQFAILPRRTVASEVAAGELTAVPLEPKLVRPMGIIFSRRGGTGRGAVHSATARRLIDFLVEHAGPAAESAAAPRLGNPDAAPPIHASSSPPDAAASSVATDAPTFLGARP